MNCIRIAKLGFIFLPLFLGAQTPDLFWRAGVPNNENIHELAVNASGQTFVGATFENNLLSLSGKGDTDLALVCLSSTGDVQWFRHFGSILEDEWGGLTIDDKNNVAVVGSFWLEIEVDTVVLSAKKNAKALFFGKFSSEGALQWVQKIEGTGLKVASELAFDRENNLLMSGYFSDTLYLGAQHLYAVGETDLFLAKFNEAGELLWARSAGYTGDTRALSLSVLPSGSIALSGFYNDTTIIGDDKLMANTFDRDVFVCLYDAQGRPRWARRAGGVHDDAVTSVRYASDDVLYVAGYLVGVISLSDDLSIQSATGNSDFYLLKYDTSGAPLDARAYGGLKVQQTTDLLIWQDQIWLSGFYQGEMTIDEQTTQAGRGIGAFLARFDSELQLKTLHNFPSEDNTLINALTLATGGRLLFGGAYSGTLNINNQNQFSADGFDLFVGQIRQVTPSVAITTEPIDIKVYPNPASDQLNIQTSLDYDYLRLINLQGVPVFETRRKTEVLSVGHLPPGLYFLSFFKERKQWTIPVKRI